MQVTNYTEFRKNLANFMKMASENHEPILVWRGSSKPAGVYMSLDSYNAYEETSYIASNPHNKAHLDESITEAEAGKVVAVTLDQLESFED